MTDGEDKPYLAVCAIYRWAAPYLREWIEFHRLVGAERFFLYDNESDDEHLEALAPFLEDGSVVLHYWPVFPGQPSAYNDCLARHGDDARWIAFLDTDEFLFSPSGRPLTEVLTEYEQWPGIGVNRAWMSSSGHRTRPEGLVTESYTTSIHSPDPNRTIKSIVDPGRVELRLNPHAFTYKGGALAVDEHKQPFEGWTTESLTYDSLRINHYYWKSEEEAVLKFARPHPGTGKPRPVLKPVGMRRHEQLYGAHDDAILRYVPALKEALAKHPSQ